MKTQDPLLISKLHILCQENKLDPLKDLLKLHPELINTKDTSGNTLLLIAIKEKHINIIQYLISFNINVNSPNNVVY